MFKAKRLKSNPIASVSGVLVNYNTGQIAEPSDIERNPDVLFVVVARANNAKFREKLQKLMEPELHRLRTGKLDLATADTMAKRAAASTILLDWKNMADDDGKPLPYSPAEAEKLFNEAPDFFNDISAMSENRMHYALEAEEAAAGN